MSREISTKIHELPRLQRHELRALWQELFAKPAHRRLRRNLMIRSWLTACRSGPTAA